MSLMSEGVDYSAGSGADYVRVNKNNLSGLVTLLTELKTAVDGFDTTISTFKTEYTTASKNYSSTYRSNHTKSMTQFKDETPDSYQRRKDNARAKAEQWITGKRDEALGKIDTLAASEKLSTIKSAVDLALDVFTNIEAAIVKFDDTDFEIDYNMYFTSAVRSAEAKGWLTKNYSGGVDGENSGGIIEDGKIQYEQEDGSFEDGETGRRLGFAEGVVVGAGAVAGASMADTQGWTPDEKKRYMGANYERAKEMVDRAKNSGTLAAGDDRQKSLDRYKDVTGKEFDPEAIEESTRQKLRAAGIDPDTWGMVMTLSAGGGAGTTVAAASAVALAAMPQTLDRAMGSMTEEQVSDWRQRLARSPITGEMNEDIARDMGFDVPLKENNSGFVRGTSGVNDFTSRSENLRDIFTGSEGSSLSVLSGDRIVQEISDSISTSLPGGRDISSYTPREQSRVIEQQALEQYYGRSNEEIEAERLKLLQETEDAYNGINVDTFKENLKNGGYSDADISYILEHKEVGFTAYVMASQANALAGLSKNIAAQNGIIGFDSSFDNGLSSMSLYNGQAQASLGAELDPDVTDARSAVARARAHYQQKVDDANVSIEEANKSRDELNAVKERIVKKSGSDTSKWSDEEVEEYNNAVKKYNDANKKAGNAVDEANRSKDEYENSEAEYKKVYDTKYQEYLKEAQEGLKGTGEVKGEVSVGSDTTTDSPTSDVKIDGSDDAILDSVIGGQDGLVVGDGGTVDGVTKLSDTPVQDNIPESYDSREMGYTQSYEQYDGSDQAILGGLNLGGSDLSIGAPDPGVRIDAPTTGTGFQSPIQIQHIDGGTNNLRINANAFANGDNDILNALNLGDQSMGYSDDRVIPGLGLDVNMTTITGGNVNGISVNVPQAGNYSDSAILNGLTVTENSISNGGPQPIETPTLNSLPSSGFDQAMSGFASTESEREDRREAPKKTDNSRFVEPPVTDKKEVKSPNGDVTEVRNGITIEIGEDGSLKL